MKLDKVVKNSLNPILNFKNICKTQNCLHRIGQLIVGVFKLLAWALIAPPLIGGAILLCCYIKKNCCKKTENTKNTILSDIPEEDSLNTLFEVEDEISPSKNAMTTKEKKVEEFFIQTLPIKKKNGYGGDSENDKLDRYSRAVRLFTKFKNLPGSTSSNDYIHVKLIPITSEHSFIKNYTQYEIRVKDNPIVCNIKYREIHKSNRLESASFFVQNQESQSISLNVDRGHYYNVDRLISKALKIYDIHLNEEEINLNRN